MPLYDYQCRDCQQVTEIRHGFRETYDGSCPACGGEMARVFNPAGIVFKGSGFYVTDSRKSSGSSDSSNGSPAGSSASGSSSSESSSGGSASKKSETAA
ncbi:MAG TPA: FmdB family zinc ribbon protein [Candidatus Baltobacteraceae bacterium]|nr:FmdB family zinc ribbon protein [Candidatus Baltobacteraceae bacterium]